MGNSPSQEEVENVGYRVLGVQANSPASSCGLVSFFDFIVEANGIPLKTLDTTFIDLIKASEDVVLPIRVFNSKSATTRDVALVPSRKWPGDGMLGITIRFDSYHNVDEDVVHILDVEAGSPADLAGLQADSDYLLGTSERVFKSVDALFEELQAHINKTMEIYVYNSNTDEVRNVVIMPSDEWGGEGLLGAGLAHGFLHRLPPECRKSNGIAVDGFCNINANSAFGSNSDQSSVSSPAAVVNVVGGSSSESSPVPEVKDCHPSGEQTQVEQDLA